MIKVARKSEYTQQVRMQSAWYTAIFAKKRKKRVFPAG